MTHHKLVCCFFLLLIFPLSILFGQPGEKAAIREVIEAAGNGAYMNNYAHWADHWSDQDILFHYASSSRHYLFHDWEALSGQMREKMEGGPAKELPFVERSNFQYRIDGNLAWIHFDQKDEDRESKEQRVLVKEKGKWKIVNMTAIEVSSFEKQGPIRRLLYFSYKDGTPRGEIELVKQKFQEMVELVDGMEKAVWMESSDVDSPYRYSLLMEFTNQSAVKSYESHENHQVAVDKWKLYGDHIIGHTYREK